MTRNVTVAIIMFALVALARAANTAPASDVNLIPWPAHLAQHGGQFTLTDQTTIAADDAFANEAAKLAKDLSVQVGKTGAGISLKKADGLPDEGYTLDVTPDSVTITASTSAGAFYGGQTLRQLVTGKTIPCVSIQDAPRIAWRGFMLDVSRHFYDKTEVEAMLDQMAALKLNRFHWHLTDDNGWRIEIKKYPKLTTIGAWHPVTKQDEKSTHFANGQYGGFYTQDDIREVVAYAAARHIQVVPEIDMPGHMSAAAAAYPELSPTNGWTPIVARQEKSSGERCAALCVGREQTITFCKDVLTEVVALFPSKEIHIGGDEVFYEQWAPCPDMQACKQKTGAKDWEAVQVAFGNQIAAFLVEQGRTPICWNNIYRQSVDKHVINHFWRSMGPARDFANAGYDVLLSPYVYYFDHGQKLESAYQYDPLAIGVKPDATQHIRGIEGCAWTEHIVTVPQMQNYIFPRLIAIAETGWTPQEMKNWDSFQRRLLHLDITPRPNTPAKGNP
jgi:hexosaminidase